MSSYYLTAGHIDFKSQIRFRLRLNHQEFEVRVRDVLLDKDRLLCDVYVVDTDEVYETLKPRIEELKKMKPVHTLQMTDDGIINGYMNRKKIRGYRVMNSLYLFNYVDLKKKMLYKAEKNHMKIKKLREELELKIFSILNL